MASRPSQSVRSQIIIVKKDGAFSAPIMTELKASELADGSHERLSGEHISSIQSRFKHKKNEKKLT